MVGEGVAVEYDVGGVAVDEGEVAEVAVVIPHSAAEEGHGSVR